MFGLLPYDLKNEFEDLNSANPDFMGLPALALFVPKNVITVNHSGKFNLEKGTTEDFEIPSENSPVSTQQITALDAESKSEYISKINRIKDLIREGEVYELNYCRQNRFEYEHFNFRKFYRRLRELSPAPMSALFTFGDYSTCSASMERFISRHGNTICSQPIKGTIRRGSSDTEDQRLKLDLYNSEKDRAENVMIVDLVRNDMGRICLPGTINVAELFGIHSFGQVHQMISTIEGRLKENITFSEILRAMFPMGSMTGAPKIAAMNRIEEMEEFRRSWYSGALGYISPDGSFDFNVMIRSLFINEKLKRLSYSTGGAITIDSNSESEWNECLLKGIAIQNLLLNQ
ncbi:anthranilate synthase component I family protein [bacterium]|nr:anthranilate synthase component I family protein [bacterium]